MKSKRKKNYWQQDIRRLEYLKAVLKGVATLCLIAYLFYGTPWVAVILSPYMIWHIKSWKQELIKQKKQVFRMQFKEMIQSLSAALNVGYSAENAMRETVKDLQRMYGKQELIMKELSYMIRQMQMNMTIERVLQEFAVRTGEEDVQTFVTVFTMAKRSGGDTMSIIRNVVRQMGEKIDVEREIATVLSAKKLEFRIMTLIPLGMIVYLRISFPHFFQILYGNLLGVVVMSICLLIYLAAYGIGKWMIEIEV